MRLHPLILPVSLTFAITLGGCRVEPTPDEYIDHARSVEAERRTAEDEVRARLTAFVSAAARGSAAEAQIALNPTADAQLIAPGEIEADGAESIRAMMAALVTTPISLRLHELDVETGPEGRVAWFRMEVEGPGTTPEPSLYRASGTFLREEGLWRLVQAHVSGPVTTAPEDSTSNPPDSGATPGEDG